MARPQTAFELQKALMKEVKNLPVIEAAANETAEDTIDGQSLADRLKRTLNRKIF
jgi:hypothetical protein